MNDTRHSSSISSSSITWKYPCLFTFIPPKCWPIFAWSALSLACIHMVFLDTCFFLWRRLRAAVLVVCLEGWSHSIVPHQRQSGAAAVKVLLILRGSPLFAWQLTFVTDFISGPPRRRFLQRKEGLFHEWVNWVTRWQCLHPVSLSPVTTKLDVSFSYDNDNLNVRFWYSLPTTITVRCFTGSWCHFYIFHSKLRSVLNISLRIQVSFKYFTTN